MKKTILKGITLCLIMCATLTSCKKAEAGPKGDKGEAGSAGINGSNGNANVKTKTFTNLVWIYNTPVYETTIAMTEINQNIVDNGAVIIALENTPGHYLTLPLTLYYTGYQALVDYEYYAGGVKIYISNSQLVQPSVPSSSLKFKITAIAGSPFIKKQSNHISSEVISIYN